MTWIKIVQLGLLACAAGCLVYAAWNLYKARQALKELAELRKKLK